MTIVKAAAIARRNEDEDKEREGMADLLELRTDL